MPRSLLRGLFTLHSALCLGRALQGQSFGGEAAGGLNGARVFGAQSLAFRNLEVEDLQQRPARASRYGKDAFHCVPDNFPPLRIPISRTLAVVLPLRADSFHAYFDGALGAGGVPGSDCIDDLILGRHLLGDETHPGALA